MKQWNPFTLEQWIAWMIATATAGITGTVGLIAWAEKNFEGKEQAEIKKQFSEKHLERIEYRLEKIDSKVDRLLEKK